MTVRSLDIADSLEWHFFNSIIIYFAYYRGYCSNLKGAKRMTDDVRKYSRDDFAACLRILFLSLRLLWLLKMKVLAPAWKV